ncbi:MAG: fatty acid desaturase [Pseudomonadales bacterium]
MNYHCIHHLFPKVPLYHYKKLFNEIEPGMAERGAPIIRM